MYYLVNAYCTQRSEIHVSPGSFQSDLPKPPSLYQGSPPSGHFPQHTYVHLGQSGSMKILLIFFVLSCTLWVCGGHGQRPMSDETYSIILKLLKGEFHVPVDQRSRTERSAIVRFYRNRHLYTISDDGQAIMCGGKLAAKKSAINSIVMTALDDTKGSCARKLNVHLSKKYSGVSRRNVQSTLDRCGQYQLLKAKFSNKPIPKPIRAKEVQHRHQINLLDMGTLKVKHGPLTYRYILTTVDVFSRYVWLRPLQSKRSSEIAKHLKEIYCEHGPPKFVQHDRGKEFRGEVQRLLNSLKIHVIQSSAYHPQSQGKVERTHRMLRKKII